MFKGDKTDEQNITNLILIPSEEQVTVNFNPQKSYHSNGLQRKKNSKPISKKIIIKGFFDCLLCFKR